MKNEIKKYIIIFIISVLATSIVWGGFIYPRFEGNTDYKKLYNETRSTIGELAASIRDRQNTINGLREINSRLRSSIDKRENIIEDIGRTVEGISDGINKIEQIFKNLQSIDDRIDDNNIN